jgi:hypothetical protein
MHSLMVVALHFAQLSLKQHFLMENLLGTKPVQFFPNAFIRRMFPCVMREVDTQAATYGQNASQRHEGLHVQCPFIQGASERALQLSKLI